MGKISTIEWLRDKNGNPGATWGPWRGCTPVSEGCLHCYMDRGMKRWGHDPRKIVRAADATFYAPLKWKEPKRIFVCSWSDFFHPDVPRSWRLVAWEIMRQSPQHTFLILTKRIEGIQENLMFCHAWVNKGPFPNVWLGVSVENKDQLWRVDKLLQIPAAKRFISVEPMLEGITPGMIQEIDWVICGGESGPGARPMHPDWARSLRDQCQAAGVPFFFKQWGEWIDSGHAGEKLAEGIKWPAGGKNHQWDDKTYMFRVGKKAAGRLLDGREWNECPK